MSLPFDDPVCVNSSFRAKNSAFLVYAPGKLSLMLACVVVFIAWAAACVAAVVVARRRYERMRVRPLSTVVMAAVMTACLLVCGPANIYWYPLVPCWLYILAVFMIIPVGGVTIFSQLLVFYLLIMYTELLKQANKTVNMLALISEPEGDDIEKSSDQSPRLGPLSSSPGKSPRHISGSPVKNPRPLSLNLAGEDALRPVTRASDRNNAIRISSMTQRMSTARKRDAFASVMNTPYTFSALVAYLVCGRQSSEVDKIRVLQLLKVFISPRGRFIILCTLLLPFLILALVLFAGDPVFLRGCTACGPYNSTLIVTLIIMALLVVVSGARMAWAVRQFPDKWGLANEARHLVFGAAFTFVGFVIDTFTDTYGSTFDFLVVVMLGSAYMCFAASFMQIYKARREARNVRPFAKRESQLGAVISSQQVDENGAPTRIVANLNKVLADSNLAALFEQHLAAEFALENVLFYRDVQKWKETYSEAGAATSLARARLLAEAYIVSNAPFSINIPFEQQLAVEDAVFSDVESVPVTVFDDASLEVRILMERGPLPRFLMAQQGSGKQ